MLKIRVNNSYSFETEKRGDIVCVNSARMVVDTCQIDADTFHLLHKYKSYRVKIIEINRADKTCIIKVNANKYSLTIEDQFDILLHELGFDNLNPLKVADLKAPMPGLVLKIFCMEGAQVKKGDNLLVLEAMKMENSIKAPADLKIKSLKVKPNDTVEKNQVMIVFE